MEKRRQRILTEARRAIAERGFQGLSTRSLAQAAGVTQPTLYNLIGKKDDILLLLITETMASVDGMLADFADADPLTQLESMAKETTRLFGEDEDYYRASFVAHDFFSDQEKIWGRSGGLMRWAVERTTQAFEAAQEEGLLRGSIPARTLGEQFFTIIRVASRDWAFRLISIEEFRDSVLSGLYVLLSADADEPRRGEFVKKLARLKRARRASPQRRRRRRRGPRAQVDPAPGAPLPDCRRRFAAPKFCH